ILSSAARVCERSAYCSTGKLKGYVGSLDTAAQLQKALESTAFKKEVIVFADTRISTAAQTLARFRGAGYGHVLAVMEEPLQCQYVRSVFVPWLYSDGPISCGTYATKDSRGEPYPARFEYFERPIGVTAWWRKWMTVARAVALGYNVMAVDSDVLVLDDWYWRVKQPPLSQYNMLSQNERGLSFNGGFSYIQNAAPNGPVSWLLYEALHRVVRWTEDDSVLQNTSARYREKRGLRIDDQGMLQECVYSAALGRPIYPSLLYMYGNEKEAYEKLGTTEKQLYADIMTPVFEIWYHLQNHTVQGELAKAVCEHYMDARCNTTIEGAVIISSAILKAPHSGGSWPLKLGGYPFNRQIGPRTAAFRRAFADLGVPLPPDPDDPATEAAARAIQTEKFGYLAHRRADGDCTGCWAESSWWMVGRHGWWHTHLLGNSTAPKVAMGHIWARLFPGDFQKEMVLMLTGHYDWRVAARVARSRPRVYLTNQPLPGSTSTSHHHVPEVRTVVAFAPGVIHAAMSKEQFIRAAQGLAQVAVTLGAIAAWPAVPCDSGWALLPQVRNTTQRPLQHSIPWSSYLDVNYQVQPFGDSLEQLKCEWPGFAHADCICNRRLGGAEVGRGMLAVEFHHLTNGSRAAPPSNSTLVLGEDTTTTAPLPPAAGNTEPQRVPYADLLRLNAESVLRRLQREVMPVFWLDRLVEVVGMQGEAAATYQRWYDKCPALSYLELPEQRRANW
ncbi:hypothetical protein Agub_g3503, partial [Astrephomene gubernaculifera]